MKLVSLWKPGSLAGYKLFVDERQEISCELIIFKKSFLVMHQMSNRFMQSSHLN